MAKTCQPLQSANTNPQVLAASTSSAFGWPALAAVLLFISLGSALIPYPGLQEDEVIFATLVYRPELTVYQVPIGKKHLPLMSMTYLGTVKTWLGTPIFRWWKPSRYSVRIPSLLLYASSIWILFAVLRRAHSWRAGVIGVLLLATDPAYVLTGTFAWCSLQNVLMIGMIALALRFHVTDDRRWLAGAAFCTGLLLWDKALSLWILSGLFIALAIIFPREAWPHLTRWNLAVALPAFVLGAFPLLLYNVTHEFVTFRSNAHFTTAGFAQKVHMTRAAAEGSAWMGYLANVTAIEPHSPETQIEHWSARLHDSAGDRRRDGMGYADIGALILLPLLWLNRNRRMALRTPAFFLIALSIAWLQMALTEGAGGGAHHPALFWPIPHLFMAIVLAEASFAWKALGSRLLVAVLAVLMTTNVLVINQYLYDLFRFGGAGRWSDAVYRMSDQITGFHAPAIFAADWGMFNPLMTLHRGKLHALSLYPLFVPANPSEDQRREAARMFAEPGVLWIRFARGYESFPGINEHLDRMAAAAGYRKMNVTTVPDTNGRPVFEVFRVMKQGPVAISVSGGRPAGQ